MKTKLVLTILAWLAASFAAPAQTNDAVALMQRALFEEEANRQLDAAIGDYKQVIEKFDQERQLAATAIFRLGECYRKQGRTNEANVQYQRILHEFPDQADLVHLSQAYVPAGVGGAPESSALLSDEEKFLRKVQESTQTSPDLMNVDLLIAAQNGYVSAAEFLIARGVDLNLRAPIVAAAVDGNDAIVRSLLTHGAKVDSTGDGGRTALGYAVSKGFMAVCRTLVAAGANMNFVDSSGMTPLLIAIENDQPDAMELFLSNKAQINVALPPKNVTPLEFAISKGNHNMVALLLSNHADANLESCNIDSADFALGTRMSPLCWAIVFNRPDVVKLFLENGVDPNVIPTSFSTSGETPVMLAVSWGRSLDIILPLLDHGAKLNPTDQHGETALVYAIRRTDTNIVRALVEHGADVNIVDKEGKPPLEQIGNPSSDQGRQIRALLIQAGADANYERRRGIWLSDRSGNPQKMEFGCPSNSINHFTLLEFLADVYQGDGSPFPDFAHLTVHRLEGKSAKALSVDLSGVFASGDISRDMALQPGDVVEIPQLEHKVADPWNGLSNEQCEALNKCLFRMVQITTRSTNASIALDPSVGVDTPFPVGGGGGGGGGFGMALHAGYPFHLQNHFWTRRGLTPEAPAWVAKAINGRKAAAFVGSFWLNSVLRDDTVLLNTWDLSNVQLTRGSLKMTFNLTTNNPPQIWLEDGDVIHIKEYGESAAAETTPK